MIYKKNAAKLLKISQTIKFITTLHRLGANASTV